MKNRIFCMFLGLCLFAISPFSCSVITEKNIRSYVVDFFDSNDFRLESTPSGNIAMFWCDFTGSVSMKSVGEEAKRYDALCEKYDDLSYNKKTRYLEFIYCREYPSNEIILIDVVSNVDFDSEHPAGSSLDGLVRLLSASPARFIKSGYKEKFDWKTHYPEEFFKETSEFHLNFCYSDFEAKVYEDVHHHPVNDVLKNLKQNNLQLLGRGYNTYDGGPYPGYFFGYLTFDKEPDVAGIHELTVTVHLADGRELSHTIEKTF